MSTVGELRQLQEQTKRLATPHRIVDWDALGEPDDAKVTGCCLFIEEYNTGYGGVLERWSCEVNGKRFYMDVLPSVLRASE